MNVQSRDRTAEMRSPVGPTQSGLSFRQPRNQAAQPTRKILTLEIEVMEERIAPGQGDRWKWKWFGNRCETLLGEGNDGARELTRLS